MNIIRDIHRLLLASLLLAFYGCTLTPNCNKILIQIKKDILAGNLKDARLLADSIKKICPWENRIVHQADSLEQIAERISLDFSLTEEQVISKLNKTIGSFSPEDKTSWEKSDWLEYRILNGEKRYFNRSASNLLLI